MVPDRQKVRTEGMDGRRHNYIPTTLSGDNNPNIDLVNMNAYIKIGKILSIHSQDIAQKRNYGVNQGP